MLPKNARRTPVVQAVRADLKPYFHAAKRFLIFGVVAEISLLAASYYGFRELNNSIETRHYFAKNYPTILEGYYYVTDKVAGRNFREEDQAIWSQADLSWNQNE